jgi:hypothetical protein
MVCALPDPVHPPAIAKARMADSPNPEVLSFRLFTGRLMCALKSRPGIALASA